MDTIERLIQTLNALDPEWRTVDSDPYVAAEYYGIAVPGNERKDAYEPLDFSTPDYRYIDDGFTPPDYD